MPQLKLALTGGVALGNTAQRLGAEAANLGIGSALVNKASIKAKDWAGMAKLARQFVDIVNQARASLSCRVPATERQRAIVARDSGFPRSCQVVRLGSDQGKLAQIQAINRSAVKKSPKKLISVFICQSWSYERTIPKPPP